VGYLQKLQGHYRKAGLLQGILVITFSLTLPLFGQDKAPGKQDPKPQEENLQFKFNDASFDAVLAYVSKTAGYTFVIQAPVPLNVTAISQAPIPKRQVIDFLNTVLKPKGIVALVSQDNPRVVEIVTLDEAKRKHIPVRVGADPAKMERGEQVIIQVIPLQALEVADFDRELRILLPKTAEVAKDTANNALILTDSSDNIRRFLTLLSELEGMKYDPLRFKVIELKNADASDVARVIQDFVRKEQSGPAGKQSAFSWQKAWFPDSPDRAGKMRSATSDIIKAIPEPKGNFIVLVATQDNLKLVEGLISQIDLRISAVAQVKVYRPRGAGAKELGDTILQLFRAEPAGPQVGQGVRQTRQLQWWDPQKVADVVSAYPVKALPDVRSNALMVTATTDQLKLIDRIVESFDVARSSKIYQLRFAEAKPTADFVGQLFKGQVPEISALAEPRTNTLVVTASDEQLAVLDGMVTELDRQLHDSLRIKIFPVKSASAEEVAATLAAVLKSSAAPGTVALRPIEATVIKSTNSIVIRGPEEYFKIVEQVIAHHEVAPKDEKVAVVIRLRNASAKSVVEALRATGKRGSVQAVSGFSPAMPPLPSVPSTPAQTLQDPARPQLPQAAAAPTLDAQADEGTNTVVLNAFPHEVAALRAMITELDQYRPQVLIRVLIADVSIDHELQYGVEAFIEDKLKIRGKTATQRAASTFTLPANGFSYLLSGSEYQVAVNALATDGRLKVLATPRILALDNQTATLSTGRRVPFINTSRQTSEGSLLNTVQYVDVGIILKVTPRITSDGLVTMYVRPEVSNAAPATESVELGPGVVAPVFDSNYAETTVTARTGQTIILGGLMRESMSETKGSIPILGDIPILGALFSTTSISKQKRELVIFLTPQVAASAAELEELTAVERGRLKEIDQREISSEVKRWLRDAR
jgi:type II secretion system protein D